MNHETHNKKQKPSSPVLSFKFYDSREGGFSLLESIVAISLFIVIMTIIASGLILVGAQSKKVLATRQLTDNLALAVDDMVRNMRLGVNYHCGDSGSTGSQDCVNGDTYIEFDRLVQGEVTGKIAYRFNEEDNSIEKSRFDLDEGAFYRITENNVTVEGMQFFVTGSSPGDNSQANVRIVVTAVVGEGTDSESNLHIQTSVSMRSTDS